MINVPPTPAQVADFLAAECDAALAADMWNKIMASLPPEGLPLITWLCLLSTLAGEAIAGAMLDRPAAAQLLARGFCVHLHKTLPVWQQAAARARAAQPPQQPN